MIYLETTNKEAQKSSTTTNCIKASRRTLMLDLNKCTSSREKILM